MTDKAHTHDDCEATDREGLAATCAELQDELDTLLGTQDADQAVASLDSAVASLREVEERNVSSVQLVALVDD